jgi:hypothetical protein
LKSIGRYGRQRLFGDASGQLRVRKMDSQAVTTPAAANRRRRSSRSRRRMRRSCSGGVMR